MVVTSTVCNACGSHSVPKDANFCPTCGKRIESNNNNLHPTVDQVPLAPAVPLGSDVTIEVQGQSVVDASSLSGEDALTANAVTVTVDEDPGPQQRQYHGHQATNSSGVAPPTNPEYNSSSNNQGCNCSSRNDHSSEYGKKDSHTLESATFWKNPTAEMMEQASQYDAMGGILFIQSSNYCKGQGKFTVPKTIHIGQILTGTKLDLSHADFVHPVTTITVGNVLGGAKITVPRGVRVETRGLGILGGFKGLSSQTVNASQTDAPLVIVQGLAILGGAKVCVNERVPPLRVVY